jgi:arylsulfatase A-like enzyme
VPLLVRHPEGAGAGTVCDAWVQHHDLAATVLDIAGVRPPEPIEGRSVWQRITGAEAAAAPAPRDHVVVGWGSAITVIDERWWLNCKVDGRGVLLHDRSAEGDVLAVNLADQKAEVVGDLTQLGHDEADRGGGIPEYLREDAARTSDAPGCSPFAALPLRDA